jgi:hypothetical protein
MKKTTIASALGLALLGTGTAHASLVTNVLGMGPMQTDRANFTMLAGDGSIVGGTNDVNMYWDGNAYNSGADYTGPGSAANVTASSVTAFFGRRWTAHEIQVFVPGSYTFDTSLGGGNPESGTMNMTIGAGQLGMHMLFDWGSNFNIDVVVVAGMNQVFSSGNDTFHQNSACYTSPTPSSVVAAAGANCLWAGAGYAGGIPVNRPSDHHVWMLASVDQTGGDGTPGTPMAPGGPFAGFNANFNADLVPVPIPAAAWLFGSGLLGLLGMVRKHKRKPA